MKRKPRPKARARTAYGLLGEIKRIILEDPRRYDQFNTLSVIPAAQLDDKTEPPCGTVGCVAGWVVALTRARLTPYALNSPLTIAERVLGLTEEQGDQLFDGGAAGWRTGVPLIDHAQRGADHIERFRQAHKAQLLKQKVTLRR